MSTQDPSGTKTDRFCWYSGGDGSPAAPDELFEIVVGPGGTRNLQQDRYERACSLEGLGEH